jgi:hypothetical protein
MSSKAVIKQIEPNGLWNGLTKYKVTFKNGKQYTFFAKGDFKFSVGSEIKYEVTNEEYKNARIPLEEYKQEDNNEQEKPMLDNLRRTSLINEYKTFNATGYDVKLHNAEDEQIRLNCILAAANFNQLKTVNAETVIEEAKQFFNYIKQQ